MLRIMRLNVALASLAFAACVTINVYFPAAAAEQAADQIIDKVTSGADAAVAPAPPPRGSCTIWRASSSRASRPPAWTRPPAG